MNYSDNNSLSSFNPVDYIDLDAALAEEELASITHSSSRNADNYRFSLRSIEDKDLDSFRRSLITPMAINSNKAQSPLYSNMTNTRHSPPTGSTKNHILKRQNTISPTHSCGESVTESVALFNSILDDDGIDLVKSDLKDFMSPYDMDDLISRPGSRLPNTTPSPQNIGRFNRDALVSRRYNQSATLPEKEKASRHTNIERDYNLNDNLLTTTTNMDTKDKVTQLYISKPNSYNRRDRKSSVDASVQTQTRRMSTSAIQTDIGDSLRQIPQNTIQDERNKQKTPSLLKLSQDQQIHPSPRTASATTRTKKSDDKRRWSSYTSNYADEIGDSAEKPDTVKSHRLSAINPLSSRYGHKSINNSSHSTMTTTNTTSNLLPSSRYVKEKRSSIDLNASGNLYRQQASDQRYSSISRPAERRASERSSLISDQQQVSEAQQRSSQILERRASNRNSLVLNQSKYKQAEDLDRRVPTLRSRGLPPTNHQSESNEQQQRSKLAPTVSKRSSNLERRSSHGALSLVNKGLNESGNTKQSLNEPTRGSDITLSNRYVQRRSSHREISLTNLSSVGERRSSRDISDSFIPNRRVERRSSIQEPSTRIHQQVTTAAAKNTNRYSYHGGYGSLSKIDSKLTEDAAGLPTSAKTDQQQRRSRALSVPASTQSNNDQVLKPSLMPVPVSRFRKHSNNSLSRYETVPEDDVAPLAKEVRFSLSNREENTKTQQHHEEILPVSSRSTGGYSNSTASSSHSSGDIDYDPPTPPSSFNDRLDHITKRRSMPSFVGKEAPRLNRYGSYLARLKDTYETTPTDEDDDQNFIEPTIIRRQRVVSEDNESHKAQQRRQQQQQYQNQNAVTESARQLLAQVQERRAKTAAILNGIYGP